MRKKEIRKHINEYFKKIHLLSENSAKHFRKDEIHRLRVEIKKLRAFLRLLSAAQEKPSKLKISKSLKAFYKCAGEIRNIQNHITWVKDYFSDSKPPPFYISHLKKKLKEHEQNMHAAMPSAYRFKSNREEILKELPGEMGLEIATSFMNHKKIEIKKILGSQKTDEVLHALRKELKDIHYNRTLIQQYINLAELPVINSMKEILQLLGNHQDYFIHLHYLSSFDDAKSNELEKRMLHSAKEEALKVKSTLRNQVLQKISG